MIDIGIGANIMEAMQITPLGDSALIIRVRDQFENAPEKTLNEVLDAFHRIESAAIPGVFELAPAYTTVAVFFDPCEIANAGANPDQILDCVTERIRAAVTQGVSLSRPICSQVPTRRGPSLLRPRVCLRCRSCRATRSHLAAGSSRSPQRRRIPRRLHRVHARFSVSDRSSETISHAAPGDPEKGNSRWFSWHRRRTDGNLSAAITAAGTLSVGHRSACSIRQRVRPRYCARAIGCDFARFNGYHRSNGDVGTANYWLFIPTVFCENRNLDVIREALHNELGYAVTDKYKRYTHQLAEAFKKGQNIEAVDLFEPPAPSAAMRPFKNVDGIKFLNRRVRCGGTRQDASILSKLLAAYANHPNVAGVTILSLGCQNLQVPDFMAV